MYDRDEESKRIVTRLKRLEGQLRGLQRLVEMGEDCESVLTQFAAAKGAFQRVGEIILASVIRDCVAKESSDNKAPEESIESALALFEQYVRHLQ
ncbi:MAG TPA: metal-sensitive transcriptional regulator [Anaerolineae bacterium]|jgi:DNA-binding FrmR family transcriptional regulator|nr:metal-sensitive transcriptional regulator [Anaerolineae bacterium]